jgi:hypothetical protein
VEIRDEHGIAINGSLGPLSRNNCNCAHLNECSKRNDASGHNEVRFYYANLMTRGRCRGMENEENRKGTRDLD